MSKNLDDFYSEAHETTAALLLALLQLLMRKEVFTHKEFDDELVRATAICDQAKAGLVDQMAHDAVVKIIKDFMQ